MESGKLAVLTDPLEIFKDLVDRAFGQVHVFRRICALDDLLAHLGIQSEEPLEEITVEEPGCRTVLPPYDRSVPAVHKSRNERSLLAPDPSKLAKTRRGRTHVFNVVPPGPISWSFMLLCSNVRSRETEGSSSDMIPMSPELVQNRWVGFSAPPSPSLDTEPGMNFDTSWWRPNTPSSSRVADPLYWNENNARPSYFRMRANVQRYLLESLPDRQTLKKADSRWTR